MAVPAALSEMDAYALACIEYRVRRLIGNYGFTASDRDDLVQQLFLEYLERAGQYNACRSGFKTFVSCLVRNQATSAVRARKRALGVAMDGLPGDDPIATNVDSTVPPAIERRHFWLDLERALAPFPQNLLDTARALCLHTPTELSRVPGHSRTLVYRRLRRLRVALLAAGIGPGYFSPALDIASRGNAQPNGGCNG
jgi:RNA polymerase sigma-70 factor (ECF subfamily)